MEWQQQQKSGKIMKKKRKYEAKWEKEIGVGDPDKKK